MASMGDSITAGAIADYSLNSWKKPSHVFALLKKLSNLAGGENLEAVERKDLSWTANHANRFKKLLNRKGITANLEHWNGSVSGHASKELAETQLPALLNWSQKTLGKGAPDYVAMLIGPNDICAKDISKMTETSVFESRIKHVIEALLKANSEVKILISEIPDIERVWALAKDYDLSPIKGARNCQEVWQKMPFCANLLTNPNPDDRLKIRNRVEEYNVALNALVYTYAKTHPDQVRVAAGIYEREFSLSELSADCFHPNTKGQNMLAETTWESGWWAN
jgi:lysophospholipase L1-like esterase